MNLVNKLNDPEFLEYISSTTLHNLELEIPVKAGPFLPTNVERAWLYHFLQTEEADSFFDSDTKRKLVELLTDQHTQLHLSNFIIEKGKPNVPHSVTPLVKKLRSLISDQKGMTISYSTKNGEYFKEIGIPYRLMYNIAKKNWYLWWLRGSHEVPSTQRRRLTPLLQISDVSRAELNIKPYEEELEQLLPKYEDKKTVTLLWKPLFENMDVQRLFHAFSSFEKEIEQAEGSYQLHVHYYPEEEKYLLTKIRLFGPHVLIQAPESLRNEFIAAAKRALENYK
ncbi:WYL domain-containing protein [Fredinandcohnia humi]